MGKKLIKEQFIAKAKAVHADKYDYSKVDYVNNRTKVCIICPIHGEFWQTPNTHLRGSGCKKCAGYFVFCTEDFILEAKKIHGDKYDYSKSVFINAKSKIKIKCPIHGIFYQKSDVHINQKCGCPQCANESKRNLLFGVGQNDLGIDTHNCKSVKSYRLWQSILNRCLKDKRGNNECYKDCKICEEWLTYSNFKKWFDEHYVEGWQIDKDLFSLDEKIYSPQTCCFLPNVLNCMFRSRTSARKDLDLPKGVYRVKDKFKSTLYTSNCTIKHSFISVNDALEMYNKARIEKIHSLAEKYKDKLETRAYLKLLDF